MNIHSCDAKALCTNTEGSYECTCTDGFAKNGKLCIGNHNIFLAQSFGELITATLFGNITCLILKNSYNFYYFYDNDNNSDNKSETV